MKEAYQPTILVDTEGLSREDWLDYRRQGIGGSDAAAVLGISPWRTARDLYYDKLGVVSVFDEDSSWVQLEVGHLLEPLVARIFEKKTGFKIYQRKSMFQHPAYPWMLADLDYLVELPDGGTAILEIKTCNYNAKDNWWYNGKEIVPIYYESQARHYMCVMNIDRVYFCCLYGNTEDEAIIRTLDRDMDYENELITLESAFWNDYVLAKNPPPYTEGGDLIMESLNRWLGPNEKDIPPTELDVSQYALVQRYMELQQQRGRCDTDKKAIESEMNRIKALIIAACAGAAPLSMIAATAASVSPIIPSASPVSPRRTLTGSKLCIPTSTTSLSPYRKAAGSASNRPSRLRHKENEVNTMGIVAAFDKVIYFNPNSKYTVMRVKTADLMIPNGAKSPFKYADHLIRFTAVGYDLPQSTALSMDLEGKWVDGKYGLQLQVDRWGEVIPPTIEGIRAYLASGLLKGIGPKTADAIVQRFGTQSLRVIESHPEQLLEIRGITEEKLTEIKEGYAESKVLRDLMTILAPFKITPTTAMKIYQHFGPGGVALIRESPYRLCQMPTFGFKKVDAIVQKSDGNLYDPMRVQGALFYTLEQSRNEKGHLFLEADKLIQSSLLLLNESIPYPTQWIKPPQVQKELEKMVQSDVVVANQGKIYLPNVFKQESETAVQAVRMAVRPIQPLNVSSALERTKGKLGIVLSERQIEGVSKALRSNFSIITGGPGTGKSTVLRAVIEAYRPLYPNGKIALAAPTGKASRRMAETTGITDAVTLHSLLKLHGDDCGWQPSSPLDTDLLIVDECSMVDMWLAHQLFSRLRQDTKLLMVGDADQLESVGAGSVFRELIASELVPVTVLDQIFRQAEGSLIAYNAKLINEAKGELYYGEDFSFHKADTQEEAAEIIRRLYRQNVARAGIDQVQILSPFRDTGDVSANRLNTLIQAEANPASPDKPEISCGGKILRLNDRVMQTKNNYDAAQYDRNGNLIGTGVFNGDVGTITAIESDSLTVDYDGRLVTYPIESVKELDLAYASTIHKAQGSEYDTVIIPLFAAHKVLLTRNLLYTAITRAKRRVALVGQKKALFMAIAKSSVGKRNTILAERMQRYYHALNTLRAEGMPAA